jgi:hypothetical protein
MASPSRLAAWNAQVARWDASSSQIRTLAYASVLRSYERAHGHIRADGVHPDVAALTAMVRSALLAALLAPSGDN